MFLVRAVGFEPTASRFRNEHATTAPRPETIDIVDGFVGLGQGTWFTRPPSHCSGCDVNYSCSNDANNVSVEDGADLDRGAPKTFGPDAAECLLVPSGP
jgi:hypothetical protein